MRNTASNSRAFPSAGGPSSSSAREPALATPTPTPTPTAFFIGTESEMDATRDRAASLATHPHASVRRAAQKRSGKTIAAAAAAPAPLVPSGASSTSSRTSEAHTDYYDVISSHEGDVDADAETDGALAYGVETIASLPLSEPVDVHHSHVHAQTSRLAVPRPAGHRTLSPTYSRFGATASSILSSSSSIPESLAATFSDYPLSHADVDADADADADAEVDGDADLASLGNYRPSPSRTPRRGDGEAAAAVAAPQLIMPVLTVPSRKPFTTVGKSLGRIKLMVVGSSGTGKSWLTRAMTQCCSHIVHVDATHTAENAMVETRASSKPHPPWWPDIDDMLSCSSKRIGHDALLDRNITLVEGPGFDASERAQYLSALSNTSAYIESMLQAASPLCASNCDFEAIRALGGDETSLVGAVLYAIAPSGVTKADVKFMQALEPLVNVIPVLMQADTLEPAVLAARKASVVACLANARLCPFVFDTHGHGHVNAIYAVSSLPAADPTDMDMDASLLMSADYAGQGKLVASDLAKLMADIFSQDGANWLRHAAAKKALQWCKAREAEYSPMALQLRSRSWQLGQTLQSSWGGSTRALSMGSGFALASYPGGHSRVHMESWARDLQRSLTNVQLPLYAEIMEAIDDEMHMARRAESSALVRRDAAGEVVRRDGPGGGRRQQGDGREMELIHRDGQRRHKSRTEAPSMQQDPLGLLTTLRGIKYAGWSAVQMIGAVGLVGGGLSLGGLSAMR